jgi:hydroxyacylglutathione hydrolase
VPVVFVCGSGNRSSVAASYLMRLGRDDVSNVVGGMGAWNSAGYPTEK